MGDHEIDDGGFWWVQRAGLDSLASAVCVMTGARVKNAVALFDAFGRKTSQALVAECDNAANSADDLELSADTGRNTRESASTFADSFVERRVIDSTFGIHGIAD